jgi:hypothetical protein
MIIVSCIFLLPAPGQARGSYFFGDVSIGSSWLHHQSQYAESELAWGLTAGVGGKWPYFPVRAFLLFQYERSSQASQIPSASVSEKIGLDLDSLLGGVRLLVPIYRDIRIYGDFLLGRTIIAEYFETGGGEINQVTPETLLLTLGLQWRLLYRLSLGVKSEFFWLAVPGYQANSAENGHLYNRFFGPDGLDSSRVLATVSVHF